jgi:hypothetical protein
MIKVFLPAIKGKNKTSVRGFWRNDKGKIFYDYLSIEIKYWDLYINKYSAIFRQYLKCILKDYKQEAVFYSQGNKGFIYNGKETITLTNRIYSEVLRTNLKTEIKEALRIYGGVTIYQEAGRYFKEIYYK